MSKLTFWGRLFCPTIAERSDCHLKKWLGRLMESTNMTKMSLWFEGFLFCSPFCFGRASSLQESSKDYSLSKSNRKSDNVGLPLGSIRLVDSPYRLVAIQRHQTARYGVKYSALYFTWKYCRKRKIERILSLVAKNYYIILQIKNISQKTIIDFLLKIDFKPRISLCMEF